MCTENDKMYSLASNRRAITKAKGVECQAFKPRLEPSEVSSDVKPAVGVGWFGVQNVDIPKGARVGENDERMARIAMTLSVAWDETNWAKTISVAEAAGARPSRGASNQSENETVHPRRCRSQLGPEGGVEARESSGPGYLFADIRHAGGMSNKNPKYIPTLLKAAGS
ncbi:hypothetical protein BDV93DRAFT_541579 [Ceratobasidium sp. AG-I]|nr:hypothetical protein BDV93DRAFT_541579 [Ceratobasidium sp. AG-I]